MHKRWRKLGFGLFGCALLAALGGTAAALWFLDRQAIPPRMLAPYLAKRSSGHNAVIEGTGAWSARTLLALDRGAPYAGDPALLGFRPGSDSAPAPPPLRTVTVSDPDALQRALADARPGDAITLLPGRYAIGRGSLEARRAGTGENPIVVRAVQPGTVLLEFASAEGFRVTAPWWTFENLSIRGTCQLQLFCEHAFHVVGDAHHFRALNNRVVDFNSHFKINAADGRFPDSGAIIGNTITNTTARRTDTSVTLIDLVAASHWIIRGNVITDFIKDGGDRISYGGFAKGAGSDNVFEQNIVICEHLLRGAGQRIGLSLGGGGSGRQYCRDGRCITEQDRGVLRANLVASCSDDGIYLNSAARSVVTHNTVLDTAGIVVRFAESSADLEGNLVDGAIRSRDGGVLRLHDNFATSITALYMGYHPVRGLLTGPSIARMTWKGAPPRRARAAAGVPDLCGTARTVQPVYGAFEELPACRR